MKNNISFLFISQSSVSINHQSSANRTGRKQKAKDFPLSDYPSSIHCPHLVLPPDFPFLSPKRSPPRDKSLLIGRCLLSPLHLLNPLNLLSPRRHQHLHLLHLLSPFLLLPVLVSRSSPHTCRPHSPPPVFPQMSCPKLQRIPSLA